MDLRFRTATASDAAEAVPLMYSAGPAAYEYIFGSVSGGAMQALRRVFVEKVGFWSSENVVVATLDGRVVATGGFYGDSDYPRLSRSCGIGCIRLFGLVEGLRTLDRLRRFGRLVPPPARGMWFVQDFGVHPDLRGKGIGTALLRAQAEAARARGKRTFGLDVATNNPKAQRLYERLGFVVVDERVPRGKGLAGGAGARRMVMDLDLVS